VGRVLLDTTVTAGRDALADDRTTNCPNNRAAMSLTHSRPTEQRSITVICICLVVLLWSVGIAGAAPSESGLTYESGVVTQQGGAVYLWYSSSLQVTVTVPGVPDGAEVCLSHHSTYRNATGRVGCTTPSADDGTASARFETDGWPAPTAGSYVLFATVRTDDGNERQVHAERVVVVRKGGDVDGDGLANVVERRGPTNFTSADTDGDRLQDGPETKEYGTSPVDPDTDGDGIRDGVEITFGTDPTDGQGNESSLRKSLGAEERGGNGTSEQAARSGPGFVPPEWWPSGMPTDALGLRIVLAAAAAALVVLLVRRNLLGSSWSWGSSRVDGPVSTETGGDAASLSPDETYVLRLLRQQDGRVEQAEIVEKSGWSKAKVSRVLSRLEVSDRIEKEHVGRRNVIVLIDRE